VKGRRVALEPLIQYACSSLFLCCCLGLGDFLLVAVDHHDAYERSYHSGTQNGQDNGNTNGPDARREEVVKRVTGINEGL